MTIGYREAPQEAQRYPRDKPAATAYSKLALIGLFASIDLRKKRMKISMPKIPTVSSSKNPSEVRPM